LAIPQSTRADSEAGHRFARGVPPRQTPEPQADSPAGFLEPASQATLLCAREIGCRPLGHPRSDRRHSPDATKSLKIYCLYLKVLSSLLSYSAAWRRSRHCLPLGKHPFGQSAAAIHAARLPRLPTAAGPACVVVSSSVCFPARPESGRLVPTSPAHGLQPPIAGLPSPFATPRVRACCEVARLESALAILAL
jgi:hypothetical protein